MTHPAGRAGRNGFLATEPTYSKNRDTASSSTRPVPPDDILFGRKGARVRLAEEGDYVGIDDLGPIPPGDLLETIHRYVSRFYDRPDFERKHLHYKSMDGTALLAVGILLEEVLGQSLGETGHLAFLNVGEEEENTTPTLGWDGHTWVKKATRRLHTGNQSSRSAHIDDSLSLDEEFDEDEANDIVEHEGDGEDNEEKGQWQSSSPSGAVGKIEPGTESPEIHQERFPTHSRTETPASPSGSDHEDLDISAVEEESACKPNCRRSKRIYGDEGYKSTAMVQSSDENEDEASFSEHDIEMVDPDVSVLQRASASPKPSTDSSSSSDSDDVVSERVEAMALSEGGNAPSRFADEPSQGKSSSQNSRKSRESVESGASSGDSGEGSESEDEDAATTALPRRDKSGHRLEDTTEKETSKTPVTRPEDIMAKFKKSMDDLLERLMSQ